MFTIRCVLDDNDREQLIEPLGEIWISDGVSTIYDLSAFLDAWLDSLIGELQELQAGRSVIIDVSEQNDLRLVRTGEGVRIEFKSVTVFAASIAEFKSALRRAARDFVEQIDQIRTDADDPRLPLIRHMRWKTREMNWVRVRMNECISQLNLGSFGRATARMKISINTSRSSSE